MPTELMPVTKFTSIRSRRGVQVVTLGWTALLVLLPVDLAAQKRPKPIRRANEKPAAAEKKPDSAPGTVTISYPDTVSLAAFVDYVSQSLDLKIIYGDELKSQSVVFRPGEVEVPQSHLLDLLRSMLRMQDLALVEGDVDGWLRIVQTGDMQRFVKEIRDAGRTDEVGSTNRIVTQVVQLTSEDYPNVVKYAKQFLSSAKASVIEVPEKGLLIITDYEAALAKALEIIKLVDVAPRAAQVESVALSHADAQSVAEQVSRIIAEKAKLEGRSAPSISLQPNIQSSSVLLVGLSGEMEEARELIDQFDVPAEGQAIPITYSPTHISVARLARLIEAVTSAGADKRTPARLYIDEEANRLYVTAGSGVHRQIEQLLEREDVRTAEASRPLRVYRPKNRPARELVGALAEVLPNVESVVAAESGRTAEVLTKAPPGPNRPPGPPGPGQPPPMPPAQEPVVPATESSPRPTKVKGKDFTLSYDEHTNAIIAVGPREFHTRLETILPELDRRLPQVLIEMTLVAITFNDSLSLAVELANEEHHGDVQSLIFSSFGLSQINIPSGVRRFNPGGGINGIILGPHETPFLFRAIAAHGNSRIITTPKIVVSDNTAATIASVEDAPFTSINASDTVATTSFAGYESAGTTLTVTPHIAQGDHLALDYSFNFSNFTGGGSVGVPPPRTTNTFSGTVEVPDAHTVVIGGLVTDNEADSVTEVPLLGRIPGIGAFFQSSDRARTKTRIYAFIHPVILRDDRFADLKLVSGTERKKAELPEHEHPEGEYQWMR